MILADPVLLNGVAVQSLLARENLKLLGRRGVRHEAIRLIPMVIDPSVRVGTSPVSTCMPVGHTFAKYQPPHHLDCLQERDVINAKVLVVLSDDIQSPHPSRRTRRSLSDDAT